MITDFNLAGSGETGNALLILVQDIESIMMSSALELIVDKSANVDLEQYLYKSNQSTSRIAMTIQSKLVRSVTNPEGFELKVDCSLVATKHAKDGLLVKVSIYSNNTLQTDLMYVVSENLISKTS